MITSWQSECDKNPTQKFQFLVCVYHNCLWKNIIFLKWDFIKFEKYDGIFTIIKHNIFKSKQLVIKSTQWMTNGQLYHHLFLNDKIKAIKTMSIILENTIFLYMSL